MAAFSEQGTTAQPVEKTRELWLDIAKGIAIALVAFHHSWQFLDGYGWDVDVLTKIDRALTTIRMPLFFMVSGILAAGALQRPFRQLFANRIALLLYLYFLWYVVRTVWFSFVPWPLGEYNEWVALLISPFWPSSGLWYLYALAPYLAVAWLGRRLPVAVQISIAAVVAFAFASKFLSVDNYVWRSIGVHFLFFLIGVHFRQRIFAYARTVTWTTAILSVVVYGALCVVLLISSEGVIALLRVPVAIIAVIDGVSIAVILSRMRILGGAVGSLGRRTLPVYVLHILLISVIALVLPVGIIPGPLAVLAVTVVAIALALLVDTVVGRTPGLFTLPRWVSRLLQPRPAPDPIKAER